MTPIATRPYSTNRDRSTSSLLGEALCCLIVTTRAMESADIARALPTSNLENELVDELFSSGLLASVSYNACVLSEHLLSKHSRAVLIVGSLLCSFL